MPQVIQVKDHKENNQRLWIGPLTPLQRHSILSKFSPYSSDSLNVLRIIVLSFG